MFDKNKFLKLSVLISIFACCSGKIYTSLGNSQSQSVASSQEIFYAQRTPKDQDSQATLCGDDYASESFECAQRSQPPALRELLFNFEDSSSLSLQELESLSSSMMPPVEKPTAAFENAPDVSFMQDVYKNLSKRRREVSKRNKELDTTPSASSNLLFLVRSRLLLDMHSANVEALSFLSSADKSFQGLFDEKSQSYSQGSAGSSDYKPELARELADGKNIATYMKHCMKFDHKMIQPKKSRKRKHGALGSELDSK